MKMIQNYLDSLESYLPDELKQDVRDELEASLMSQVEDSQETLGRDLNLVETEALLKKLGHPINIIFFRQIQTFYFFIQITIDDHIF